MRNIAGIIARWLLILANINDPICVASPKVAKASTICVAVASIITGIIALTFANGNTEVWPRIAHYSLTLLALATLDDATQIGSFILCNIPQGRQGKYGLA